MIFFDFFTNFMYNESVISGTVITLKCLYGVVMEDKRAKESHKINNLFTVRTFLHYRKMEV